MALILCVLLSAPPPPASPDPVGKADYPFRILVGRNVTVLDDYKALRRNDRLIAVNGRPMCPWHLERSNRWWDHTILDQYRPGATVAVLATRAGLRYPFFVEVELVADALGK